MAPSVFGSGVVTDTTEANFRAALADGGIVTFAVSGTITLSSPVVITNDTVIDGSGHAIVLSGGGLVRVLTVNPGVHLTLKHLTVADGNDLVGVGEGFMGCGGILSRGRLTVMSCTFSNNAATVAPDNAGAIRQAGDATGLLVVTDSTFVNNRGYFGAGAIDTGLEGFTPGVRLTNCTFYGNTARIGAVLVRDPIAQASWMVNCTVAWNTNQGGATIIEGASFFEPTPARLTLVNTIVAHSVDGANGGGFLDGGHNLSSDSSAAFDHASSYQNTDPLLDPLADNGGPTWTMALRPGSLAINHADNDAAPAADQRGVARPQGLNSDIGAFETGDDVVPALVGLGEPNYAVLESETVLEATLVRFGNLTGTVTADFTTGGGTATSGVDYTGTFGSVQFTNGQTNVTISIPIANNLQPQSDRTFQITLTNISAGVEFATYTNVPVTIVDDDSAIRFVSTNYTFKETISLCAILVIREGYLSNAVSVDYTIEDGTAVAGTDYNVAAASGTLTFGAGVSSQTLWITNLDDMISEADETILLGLSNPQGQCQLGSPSSATMTIFDNERTHVVTACTEQDLLDALATGSPVAFDCDGTITLSSTLVITNDTVIDGSGHAIVLSGGGLVRVLTVNPGVHLTLKHLTVADGNDLVGVGEGFMGCGGILSRGRLTVMSCTFSNNAATVAPDNAGAIRQTGDATGLLVVTDSTFVNNRGYSGASAIDTGLEGFTPGVRLTNCTFYGNTARIGAVLVREPIAQASWMVNCTVAWNTNQGGATIVEGVSLFEPTPARLTLVNTIVAHSVDGANGGGFLDGGHNLSSDSSAVFEHASSYQNTDPLLDPLADNGGPTWTMALRPGSLAINHADNDAAPAADQRGLRRPYGSADDIGAFEWAPPFVIQGQVGGVTLTNELTIAVNDTTLMTTNGWFGLVELPAGDYTVTPLDANYVFVPTNRTVTLGPDRLNVNFTAYRRNTLSLDSLSLGIVDIVYAGTNAQLIRVLVSTNGGEWYPLATNSVGTNHVLQISTPAEGPVRLYRTERIQ